jgi:cell division septum initiation protein DivIVA
MDILHMIDRLETLLNKGWRIPFTSNIVVQEDAFLDIIDQMRITVPDEVKQARRLGAERERLVAQAQEEAERILSSAQQRIDGMVGDQEVVLQAEKRAQEILAEANQSAHKMTSEADTYVLDVLGNLEEELLQVITTVRNGIHKLERASGRTGTGDQADDAGVPESGG